MTKSESLKDKIIKVDTLKAEIKEDILFLLQELSNSYDVKIVGSPGCINISFNALSNSKELREHLSNINNFIWLYNLNIRNKIEFKPELSEKIVEDLSETWKS